MNQWHGYMNWPLTPNWRCEICGGRWLIWGFTHARCRCDTCHTEYHMRDKDGLIVNKPICWLKPEYMEPVRFLWKRTETPIDEMKMKELDALVAENHFKIVKDDKEKR